MANAAWYVVGDMTGWTPTPSASITPMTENSGTYVSEFVIDGKKYFCIADGDGSSWDDFHANHRYALADQEITLDENYTLVKGNNSLNITGDGSTYRFTFVESTKTLTITKVDFATISSIVIAGQYINGWDWTGDDKITLTRVGESNVYTADFPCTAETGFGFQVNNIWMGYNEVGAENITAPTGWITNAEDNFVLKHNLPTHYDTYTVTATWTPNSKPNSGWTIEIAGKTKDLKLQFASSEADWFKDNAWVRVEAWKNGGTHYLYDVEKPTDLKCTVSVPDNVDYWQLVRGSGETTWNTAGETEYKNAEDYIFTFSSISDGYTPTSSIIFKNMSIIGNLTGDGSFTIGQEVEMTKVSPDISWAFEVGAKINIYFSLEPTAEYHSYRFDDWDWTPLPGQDKVDGVTEGWVTLTVDQDIHDAVAAKGFRIHGHGIYVKKVTKGENAETGDVLWTGKHYVSWHAINNSATREWGNPDTYILTVDHFSAAAQAYEYKAIANHKYGVYELPGSASNNSYTFNEAGDFELTFSVNKYSHSLVLEAKKWVSAGASGYATFSSKHSLDFTGLAIKAYRAELNEGKVVLKQVKKIPNNTGVMLSGTGNVSVLVSDVGTGDFGGGVTNLFKATDGKSDIAGSDTDPYNYVFSTSPKLGFYRLATALDKEKVKVGGAYLHSDTELAAEVGSSRVGWIIDGEETTGINTVEQTQPTVENKVVYNLNGQRVMNPAKGLYIVNGKKVIIK